MAANLRNGHLGRPESSEVLRAALAEAREISDERSQSNVLEELVDAARPMGAPDALPVLDQILAAARQIGAEFDRSRALAAVAQGYIGQKQFQAAQNTANEILSESARYLIKKIVMGMVEQNSKDGLREFLISSAEHIDTAWIIVGGLAQAYPQQAHAILEAVRLAEGSTSFLDDASLPEGTWADEDREEIRKKKLSRRDLMSMDKMALSRELKSAEQRTRLLRTARWILDRPWLCGVLLRLRLLGLFAPDWIVVMLRSPGWEGQVDHNLDDKWFDEEENLRWIREEMEKRH